MKTVKTANLSTNKSVWVFGKMAHICIAERVAKPMIIIDLSTVALQQLIIMLES